MLEVDAHGASSRFAIPGTDGRKYCAMLGQCALQAVAAFARCQVTPEADRVTEVVLQRLDHLDYSWIGCRLGDCLVEAEIERVSNVAARRGLFEGFLHRVHPVQMGGVAP